MCIDNHCCLSIRFVTLVLVLAPNSYRSDWAAALGHPHLLAELLGWLLDEQGGLPTLSQVEHGGSNACAHTGAGTSLDIDLDLHGVAG